MDMETYLSLPHCTILVGLPGTGKSTYLKKNAVIFRDCVVVSSDNILEEIAAKTGKTYDEVFQDNIKEAEQLFWDRLHAAAVSGANIMVDRTNLTVRARKKVIEFVKAASTKEYIFTAEVFECDDEEHARRLASRPGKTIPDMVLSGMKNIYRAPTLDEGFISIFLGENQ